MPKSEFEEKLRGYASEFGGFVNAHVHGDRAHTRRDNYYSSTGNSVRGLIGLTLPEKQKLTWILHKGPAFRKECIRERATRLIEDSIRFGTREIYTTVDVTYNTELESLGVLKELKQEYRRDIRIHIGAYNPSGFKDGKEHEKRFELFLEAAKESDFLMGLAEKDRKRESGHIGESQHNFYLLQLAYELNIPVHFHVGQENRPGDKTLELLLDNLETYQDQVIRKAPGDFPEVVAVHAISTSCLDDEEIYKVADKMAKRRVSLITCPRAAISMLQDSSIKAPIHNSIAPVLKFASRGVKIKGIGTDNVDDIFIPNGTSDIYDEVMLLADALRFYDERILAKIACGVELDEFDRGKIKRFLKFN